MKGLLCSTHEVTVSNHESISTVYPRTRGCVSCVYTYPFALCPASLFVYSKDPRHLGPLYTRSRFPGPSGHDVLGNVKARLTLQLQFLPWELTTVISCSCTPALTNHIIQERRLGELERVGGLSLATHPGLDWYRSGWERREHDGRVDMMVAARLPPVPPENPRVNTTIGGGRFIVARLDVTHISASMPFSMPPFSTIAPAFDVASIASMTVAVSAASSSDMPSASMVVISRFIARIVAAAGVVVTAIVARGHEGGLDNALVWLVGGHGIVLCHLGERDYSLWLGLFNRFAVGQYKSGWCWSPVRLGVYSLEGRHYICCSSGMDMGTSGNAAKTVNLPVCVHPRDVWHPYKASRLVCYVFRNMVTVTDVQYENNVAVRRSSVSFILGYLILVFKLNI